jgi:flagellar export protein FliJ
MKKFKFRFEKILAHRQYVEKQKQRELAGVVDMEMKQRKKLENIDADRRIHQELEKRLLTGKIDLERLKDYTRYYRLLGKMELSGVEILGQIMKEVEKKRGELIAASIQKKIYSKLKEKHKTRYDKEVNLLLQKENDEIASRRR